MVRDLIVDWFNREHNYNDHSAHAEPLVITCKVHSRNAFSKPQY